MRSIKFWITMMLFGAILIVYACGGENSSASERSSHDGKAIYARYCILCHGEDGTREINGAKDLTKSVMPKDERVALIKTGKNLMTPFVGILSDGEIAAVAAYSMTLK
jgi:mono/diheme cytochrome c family protein